MYNDAGVTIYAWKQLNANMSDEEFEYIFNVAEALGCTHTTLELPTDAAHLKRIGDFAMKKKIYAAYHTHTQGNMTAFDQAFALSKGNMANVDFGHWVAGGNMGGTPMQFLEKHHDRISSFHLKDRTTSGELRAQPAVGHRRNADQADPPAREEEQVEDPSLDRARIQHSGRARTPWRKCASAWSTAGGHSRHRVPGCRRCQSATVQGRQLILILPLALWHFGTFAPWHLLTQGPHQRQIVVEGGPSGPDALGGGAGRFVFGHQAQNGRGSEPVGVLGAVAHGFGSKAPGIRR